MLARWLANRHDSMNFTPACASALEPEREDRTGAVGQVPLRPVVPRRVRETGVRHPVDALVTGEELGDGDRVLDVLAHAQGERLQPHAGTGTR